MNGNIRIFLEKLGTDEAAQAKLQAAANPDEAYELARSIQGGFSREEFIDVMKKIASMTQEGELSDEEVEAAAGGSFTAGDAEELSILVPRSQIMSGTPNMQAAV